MNNKNIAEIEDNLADLFGITPIQSEIWLLLISFGLGISIIVIYTGYSSLIVKMCPKNGLKRRAMYVIFDLIFWFNMSIIAFLAYYRLNGAQIRPYCFMWILCGMIIAYNIKLQITKRRIKRDI